MTYQFLRGDGTPTQEATILDAIWEAKTPIAVWVEDSEILWKGDASRVLHEFAIWCAEEALETVESPDPRSFQALRIKRLWLDGGATDEELRIAQKAARPGAWFTSRDAAWYSAHNAAWDAARFAASDAARSAAWWSAAQNAVWESQNAELEKRLEALRFPPVRRSRWEALLDDNPV